MSNYYTSYKITGKNILTLHNNLLQNSQVHFADNLKKMFLFKIEKILKISTDICFIFSVY